MEHLVLILVGVGVGVTTVLFGFGGGFVTVPVVALADAGLGQAALGVATATSALVMVVNAAVATAASDRRELARLADRAPLLALLAAGGAAGALAGRLAPGELLRWGFVAYLALTVVDLLVRPGFFRRSRSRDPRSGDAIGGRSWWGLPVGGIAAFLGVGGSVVTVPLLRRAGATMRTATTLANPLTLAIAAPALLVMLIARGHAPAAPGLVGSVDVAAALALLAGATPVVVLLRRRPPRIPDGAHATGYLLLLVAAGATVALADV
ncbi:TSUP family transporter [Cellulosimicrobium cellulans]|uniref:TSUP family transporter n=1 Tax=Cellulosimicrobium cellulans TaxID=1710 RepID=UPI001964FB93|nr:TSUP family transporter [Cellulosimicrobium cellulans]MBN0039011.1 TSUP family transporter [Cellulosimicrobium cellulans]